MLALLAKIFIPDYRNYSNPEVRRAYGRLCALAAIVLNLVLAGVKWVIGSRSGAFSICADALNNLSDAGSAVLLLLAFLLAGARPRPDRPFGHGRIEYVAGLAVAMLVVLLGFEMGINAVKLLLEPAALSYSGVAVLVLVLAVGVKCYMGYFMIGIAKKIHSEALRATGLDSFSDTLATFFALAALLIYHFSAGRWNLDGIFSLLVSLLVLKAGIGAAWETLKQLLGTTPDPEVVQKVAELCLACPEVVGIHDLVVHDYGPGRLHVSVHCEVRGDRNIFVLHEAMDGLMAQLDGQIGCVSVVHMDPVSVDDKLVTGMRTELAAELAKWDKRVMIHDFRVVKGDNNSKVIFDCVVPLDVEPDEGKALAKVESVVRGKLEKTTPVVKIDRPFV